MTHLQRNLWEINANISSERLYLFYETQNKRYFLIFLIAFVFNRKLNGNINMSLELNYRQEKFNPIFYFFVEIKILNIYQSSNLLIITVHRIYISVFLAGANIKIWNQHDFGKFYRDDFIITDRCKDHFHVFEMQIEINRLSYVSIWIHWLSQARRALLMFVFRAW